MKSVWYWTHICFRTNINSFITINSVKSGMVLKITFIYHTHSIIIYTPQYKCMHRQPIHFIHLCTLWTFNLEFTRVLKSVLQIIIYIYNNYTVDWYSSSVFCISSEELTNSWSLTLKVWGLSYLGLTRSISWLLMPWLLASPGHQQPWYWLCKIGRSLSYLRRKFNYLCLISVEEWHEM